jgi:putative transposase
MVSPARCRNAVRHLIRHFRVSERRACRALEINRSSLRYVAVPVDYEKRLVKRMNELAVEHPRWGYRMVATLLRGEGWKVNPKRVLRLWRQEGNRVLPKRSGAGGKRSQGSSRNAGWRLRAKHPHHIWGIDFMSGRTRRGGPIRILNVVDEFTRLELGCRVDLSIGTSDVMAELEELFLKYGKPKVIRCDNGREFVAATLMSWLTGLGIEQAFIEKGQPQQNCFVERFNGTMRSEVLDVEDFDTLIEARVVLKQWSLEEYNIRRPHRGHGMLTPRQFADNWKAGGK